MAAEPQSDLKKKWDIHLVNYELNNLIVCLDKVVETIRNSTLAPNIQNALLTFYNELKTYYSDQDLVNDSRTIKEYTQSYLENHSMLLIHGVLAQEHPTPEISKAVEDLLHDFHDQIRQQSAKLIGALEQVEPYAKPTTKKLDEEFYADDEEQNDRCNKFS